MGSLVAAAASYLSARQHGGAWMVRIEDIDPPREIPGCADEILSTLETFGFEWDGPIVYQSDRLPHYRDALAQLRAKRLVYRCSCSRKKINETIALSGSAPGIYPGTCRRHPPPEDAVIAWRLNAANTVISYSDLIQGLQTIRFGADQGDFLLWRKDDLPSYQLAVTVDDEAQQITEIVRGADLLHETAGQHLLRDLLQYRRPQTAHVPVLTNNEGAKLSKQTGATPLDAARASQQLCTALNHLGLRPDSALRYSPLPELWSWAVAHWSYKPLLNINNISPQ